MGCKQSINKGADRVDQHPQKPKKTQNGKSDIPSKVENLPTFQNSQDDFVKVKTTKFRDEYIIKDQLSQGAFGEIRKVIHKATGLTRAANLLRKDAIDGNEQKKMISQVQILTALDYPNILKFYDIFEDKNKYYLVSEFLESGDLFDRIIENENFSEQDAAKIMKQLLSAISYCHKHNIIHGPENIVFESKQEDANLKVIDFVKQSQKMNQAYRPPYYICPEILTQNFSNEKSDVWSCGVILFVLLSGTPPFSGKDDNEILKKAKNGKYSFDDAVWLNVSEDAKRFIKKMMEIDPKKRYSAQDALNDSWFTKVFEVSQPLAEPNLKSLKNFVLKSKLQEAIWVFLKSYFLTKGAKEKLFEIFRALDLDDDGQVTKDELKQAYVNIMGMTNELAIEEAERLMIELETGPSSLSGLMDYTEFVCGTVYRRNRLEKERLEAVFKMFDKNGDGRISAEEMRFLFNERKTLDFVERVWDEWIEQVEKNQDGEIKLEEFKEMMMSLLNKLERN